MENVESRDTVCVIKELDVQTSMVRRKVKDRSWQVEKDVELTRSRNA